MPADAPVRLGVSACLLGREVRYDGRHRRDRFLTEELGAHVEWVPVCPELDLGLGVPREPIHLVRGPGDLRLVGVRSQAEHTAAMRAYARRRVDTLAASGLDGYVLKSRSPSCGLGDVPVHDPTTGEVVGHDRGRFAAELTARLPLLPVIEEATLRSPADRDRFLERVCVHHRWRREVADRPAALTAFHRRHELQVRAHGLHHHRQLARLVDGLDDDATRRYRAALDAALRQPVGHARHVALLRGLAGALTPPDPHVDEAVAGYQADRTPWAEVAARLRRSASQLPPRLAGQTYLDPLAELGRSPAW